MTPFEYKLAELVLGFRSLKFSKIFKNYDTYAAHLCAVAHARLLELVASNSYDKEDSPYHLYVTYLQTSPRNPKFDKHIADELRMLNMQDLI